MLQKSLTKLTDFAKELEKVRVSAILLAGGSGSRMGSALPKQHLLLRGIPVVVRSALALEQTTAVREIVAVVRPGEEALYEDYKKTYSLSKLKLTVSGGETRQESAMNGLLAADPKATHLLFHDAARCLITPADIEAVILDALAYRAAALATPAKDTVKIAPRKLSELVQPERKNVCLVQTPQVFHADLYRAAAYQAKKDGVTGTDDCSLLEHIGVPCRMTVTERSERNFKITTKTDLLLAEALLAAEEKEAAAK